MKPIIIIQPIFELTADLFSSLEQHVSKDFDALVTVSPPINDTLLPFNSFDKNRSGNQTIYANGFLIEIDLIEVRKY
jgi:hypothetical protein